MKTYRPTTLKMASQHCPRAIDYYHQRVPTDRRIFGVGISAHAVIQALTVSASELGRELDAREIEDISLAVCRGMIEKGRSFEGLEEPPLPADDVWEGRDLALAYLARNPLDGAEVKSEIGMAVDKHWKPVPYTSKARIRLISDWITVTEEVGEEHAAVVLTIRDFKSAWPTDASELETVQRKAQAVLGQIFHGEGVDCIRLEVVNLRTQVTYEREIWVLEDGGLLERWRQELQETMAALDGAVGPDGLRRASPGGGCIGCPFLHHCPEGKAWAEEALEHDSAEDRARAYVALIARAEKLKAILQAELTERPIDVGGGRLVGTIGKDGRTPAEMAWAQVAEEWAERGGDLAGLLLAVKLGTSNIEAVGKVLFPERGQKGERDAWIAELMEPAIRRQFGIHKMGGQ